MTAKHYRALLDALMISDPWPDPCFKVLEKLANDLAPLWGYDGWIDAYHNHKARA